MFNANRRGLHEKLALDGSDNDEPVIFDNSLERQADYASKNNLKQVDNMFDKMSKLRHRSMVSFEKAYHMTRVSDIQKGMNTIGF